MWWQSLGLGHASESLAGTRWLALLLVGGEIEQDEEDEVGAEDDDAGECSKLFSCTLAVVGHPGKVGRGEVRVGCVVDEAEIDNELNDL